VGKHYIGPAGRVTGSLSASFQKSACLVGRLGSGPRFVGRIGLGVWVSASSQKMAGRQGPCQPVSKKSAHLVGRLGSGPHVMTSSASQLLAS